MTAKNIEPRADTRPGHIQAHGVAGMPMEELQLIRRFGAVRIGFHVFFEGVLEGRHGTGHGTFLRGVVAGGNPLAYVTHSMP